MKPVVEYYEKKGMITSVAGENTIEKIHKEIVSHIEK